MTPNTRSRAGALEARELYLSFHAYRVAFSFKLLEVKLLPPTLFGEAATPSVSVTPVHYSAGALVLENARQPLQAKLSRLSDGQPLPFSSMGDLRIFVQRICVAKRTASGPMGKSSTIA